MFRSNLLGCCQHAYRNRKVVSGTFLADVSRSQINNIAFKREIEAAILECGADSLFTLLHSHIWQPDNCEVGHSAWVVIDFNRHRDSVKANDCAGIYGCEHNDLCDEWLTRL